jgi:hypothetical protein
MIVGEIHDPKRGWLYQLKCDSQASDRCKHIWLRPRAQAIAAMSHHICKACHNWRIAQSGGRAGGLIAGRKAVTTGQIKQFIAAGLAAPRSEAAKAHMRQTWHRIGTEAAQTGQLAKARELAHTPEAQTKSWQTRKQRGTLKTSAPERAFVEQLRVWFGAVESHRYVDGFWTDAYIPCINTYVQFDGEYYHGLDRPFDQLNESQRAKFDRDRRADAHFLERGLKLIRVTDREYRELPLDEIRRRF